jgi:hypothetical protein
VANINYGIGGTNSTEIKTNGIVSRYETKVDRNFYAGLGFSGAAFITASYYFK